jgi:hypothetical protein
MKSSGTLRLAMWSGPRNISTAMMRSFCSRDDTVVCDEPLYSHYLATTLKAHPGRDEVIAAGETNWRKVVTTLIAAPPGGKPVFYQKHMTHHLLPSMDREWLLLLANCFLIRHPREVLASYARIVETPELLDLGFVQQAEIFDFVRSGRGRVPPILDAADVLRDPRRMLTRLCDSLGLGFQEAMLAWPPGLRPTDGIWARHWYGEVEKSTGFRPYQPKEVILPERLKTLYEQCLPHYERLYEHRLT